MTRHGIGVTIAIWLVAILAAALVVIALTQPANGNAGVDLEDGPPISNAQIDRQIDRAQSCRTFLGYGPYAVGNGWRTSPGRTYRGWVYARWYGRANACADVRRQFEARERDVNKAIAWAGTYWNVDAGWLRACAASEGGTDATRVVIGTHNDTGWFQFLPGTWAWMSNAAWKAGDNPPPPRYKHIESPVGQAYTAAWAFASGLSYHWFGRGC